MSLDATNWAWKLELNEKPGGSRKPLKRLLLLSLADRAGDDHCCYPSMARLERDTGLERKTVLKIIAELLEEGLIEDTGERKGTTKRVKVYRLMGIYGREMMPNPAPLSPINGTNNGTTNHANNGTLNSAVNGTQNLPKNLSEESKYKNTWLDVEKLETEIFLANDQIPFQALITAPWFERERRAFEIYNQDRLSNANLMLYHFADWLIHAYSHKYNKPHPSQPTTDQPKRSGSTQMSTKQIHYFAQKLAQHTGFACCYAEVGESLAGFSSRIAKLLKDPKQQQAWQSYLSDVGFQAQSIASTSPM